MLNSICKECDKLQAFKSVFSTEKQKGAIKLHIFRKNSNWPKLMTKHKYANKCIKNVQIDKLQIDGDIDIDKWIQNNLRTYNLI